MKVLKTQEPPLTETISTIIGRDASEKLKRTPVVSDDEEHRISFYNKGVKWLHSIIRIDKNR
jgi:hypothetical protein